MSTEILMGIIIVAVIIFAVVLVRKNAPADRHFDEMQLKIRADGYRIGFMVTVFGLMLLMLLMEGSGSLNNWIEPSFGMFVVLMAGIVTFAVYCIMKEAFFSIDQKGKYYIILCVVICVINGGLAIWRIADGSLWEGGRITFEHGSSLVCALSFLAVLVALLVKSAQLRNEVSE